MLLLLIPAGVMERRKGPTVILPLSQSERKVEPPNTEARRAVERERRERETEGGLTLRNYRDMKRGL